MDVDGTDAVQKLTILAQLGFGAVVDWKTVSRIGIESVDAIDFLYARELGYRIKLLAVAAQRTEGLELHVSPTLVKRDNPLSRVKGAFNAVRITGDSVGPVFFQGLGAGQLPTASAVVGDLIDTVLGRTAITFNALNLWGSGRPAIPIKSPQEFFGKSYLRLNAADRPGVMHEIAGILGEQNISIASMIQHESEHKSVHEIAGILGEQNISIASMIQHESEHKSDDEPAVLLLITHEVREGDLLQAIRQLEESSVVLGNIVRMRVQS